jgi:rod shape-determining protein MreB
VRLTLGKNRTPDIAVDMGSANTRIWVRGDGLVATIPTVIAIERQTQGPKVVAIGEDARKLVGREPQHTRVFRPVRNGAVQDYRAAEQFLCSVFEQTLGKSNKRPRVLATMPVGTGGGERRAIEEVFRGAGSSDVSVLSTQPLAVIGLELPLFEPGANAIVDIGAGLCDAFVLSLGGVVTGARTNAAGDAMDAAILRWLQASEHFVTRPTAPEMLKRSVGAAQPLRKSLRTVLNGQDSLSGSPREKSIGDVEIAEVLARVTDQVKRTLKRTLTDLHPELAAEVVDRGVFLVGGGAKLRDLWRVMQAAVGVSVMVAPEPETVVIRGAGRVLDDAEMFEALMAN